MEGQVLPPTQLRGYYDALHALKEQEQTALAELHAEDPARLIARFAHSVKTVADYPAITIPFHGERSKAWLEKAGQDVTSTSTFVAKLAAARSHRVTNAGQLDFDYVDREIFPLRRTGIARADQSDRRSIDLLLRDSDNLPVVGELKVAGDSPAYYALVQALMYAAELSSASQLRRLAGQSTYDFRLPGDEEAPLSIYLIAYAAPERGAYRERSFRATERLSAKLMRDRRINEVVRCIAYLEASTGADGKLVFERLF
jgi:hypothetical protein